jgi:four helix bundle protein
MQDFQKLEVWQANRRLTLQIYKLTATYPVSERFGLVSQMRRAVVRIGACIAEGCGRRTAKDKANFLQTSFSGSLELQHHLITSSDLGYLAPRDFEQADAQLLPIRKMLTSLIKKVRDD